MPIRSHLSFLKMHGLGTARGVIADASEAVARKFGRRPVAPGVEVTDFDPLDAATLADPYPHYRRLLASGPVHYNAKRGIYILSRYENVRAGARQRCAVQRRRYLLQSRAGPLAPDNRSATAHPDA